MLKRVLFTLLCLIMVYSIAVTGYRYFEPNAFDETEEGETYLDYETLKEYIRSSGDGVTHYLFFFSRKSQDCVYVKNTVMATVKNDTGLQIDRMIETVDITALEEQLLTNRLKTDWGLSSYPAFVTARTENGEIVIDNFIQYDQNHPMLASDIEAWLQLNGIYSGPDH